MQAPSVEETMGKEESGRSSGIEEERRRRETGQDEEDASDTTHPTTQPIHPPTEWKRNLDARPLLQSPGAIKSYTAVVVTP